ncbi:MAG TPA: hypothetical protein VKT29_08005 [Terriglobales bacterium]|nr:hypothetical protein [Terriglobales bacterium]
MKSFIRFALALAIALLGASLCFGQNNNTFQTGDVFVAIGGLDSTATVQWYRNGTLLQTLSTGQANTEAAGLAFDQSGNLYATVFQAANVVKFDHKGNLRGTFGSGYTSLNGDNTVSNDPESILFDFNGNAYVGQADGTRQVLKFDSSGNPLAQYSPATEDRGTDWIDLASDQKTLFYTSEGTHVKRFDLSTSTQLPDFNSTALAGRAAYAVRIMPDGEVLVADTDRVVRLDASGNVAQTYLATSLEPNNESPALFGLALDPDGKSFWTADLVAGTVWKVDLAHGSIDTTISTGSSDVGGIAVFNGLSASNSQDLHFPPGANSTATATFGNPSDPAAHSMALTITNVTNPNGIDVTLEAFYEPTDLSTGTTGIGIADGICEVSEGATEDNDFDCRLAAGGFVYGTLPNTDQVVPHCSPYHNNLCVWYRAVTTAVAGTDYTGPVSDKIAWNTNPSLVGIANNPYTPGWNNLNARLYDRHGDDSDIAFKFDITDYFNPSCNVSCAAGDPTGGGHQKTLNDWVFADVPNPQPGNADEVEFLVPNSSISPFPYIKGLPMPVTFELENAQTDQSDPTALTPPHSINIAILDSNNVPQPIQFPSGLPTTFKYNSFLKVYYIVLSSAPYTPGVVYTMQVGSDLFPQPQNFQFVVKKHR